MTDIKLTQINTPQGENYYDITFTDGDFTLTEGLITALMMSIFCEQRDEALEVPQMRGGWAGNQFQSIEGFQQGSLIWTLYQSTANEDATTQAQQFIEDGMAWLIEDGILKDVESEVNVVANYKLQAKITITRNDDTQSVLFYDLWINTIVNN